MPKRIINILEMKYEPIARDVLQLDGSTVKTVGILRNVEMALHACPGFTMTQDVSIAKVKPFFHFSVKRLHCPNRWLHIL